VRVVVLSGAGGKAFVSGADISKFETERASREAILEYNAKTKRVYAMLYQSSKPTIAMIKGYCIGGGLALACCCDLRIATKDSQFGLPAAKLALGYPFDGIKRLVDIVGASYAREICLTGKRFDAVEALAMGLINRAVPDSELDQLVSWYANTIADNAPLTIAAMKYIFNEINKNPGEQDLVRCQAMVDACFESQDYVEGRRAFMEKRKPKFGGS
jgi:enoyl-CoA hydratase/carnithine racemase